MAADPKMVALVLGKMKAKEPAPKADDGLSEGARAAAEEILGAIKSGDVTELATALGSFVRMESGKEPDEGEAE